MTLSWSLLQEVDLHTAHPFYCLGNFLIQYCWKVLCVIRVLFILYHLGNSCFHFILGRLVSCTCHSFATFYLGLLLIFHLEHFSCASLALPLFGMTLLLPIQFEGTFLEHHWSPSSILQSGRSLFLLDTFLFATLFWASLQGHHFIGFPPSILQLVGVILLD